MVVEQPVMIAVLGAHSTGKTTFLARLAHDLRRRHIQVATVADLGEQAQRLGLPILFNHTWASTLWIITRGISNELEAWLHADVVLVDRAVPDALGYYRAALEYRNEIADNDELAHLESLVRGHSRRYDLIFRTILNPSIPLGDNKVRDTDGDFRVLADRHVALVLRQLDLRHELLTAYGRHRALAHAVDFVNARLARGTVAGVTAAPELYSPEFFADPHPTYAEIREDAPVRLIRNPNGLEYWFVSRYDEAKAILADGRLAKDPRHAWEALRAAGMVRGEPGDATFDLHTTDPPDHTRLRALVSVAFTPGRVAALRPRIEEIANELLAAITRRGSGDLIEDYAYPLSLTVIAELLGVPVADRDQFREWTMKAMTPPFVPGGPEARAEGGRLLRQYVTELVAAKRDSPDADLLSALIAVREQEHRLTEGELVAITQQMLFAGHEPVTNLIGNGMISLFANPEQFALLRERPELLPQAVEELLRYDGPTARSSPSYTLADIEVGGTVIPAGSVVIVGIAAANRDPRRFGEPDRLDLARASAGHLAFGHGRHRCIGAHLARAEGEIAIGALLRLPELRPAGPLEELEWLPFPVFRGVAKLPVTCG